MRRSSFNTSASSGVSASGIFRATVVSVGDDDLLKVKIPKLGLNNVYEGVSYAGPTPAAGDVVFVGFLEGKSGSFVAFTGVADSRNTGDPAGDITSVVAGTNLNGGGSSGTVTVNLESDITLTSVTADAFYGDLYGAIHILVKNVSGGSLTKGTPVYATGAVGASGAVEVEASLAGTGSTMPAMGLLDQDLDHNGEGDVVVSGVLQNFDTDTPGYSVGDELYVAPSGGLTTTRPSGASELVQKIGKVIRVQQSTGEILVQGAGRTNDVPNNIVAGGLAIDTDTLYVDAANDRVGIGTTSPTHTLTVDGNTMITANQSYYINSDTSGVGRLRLHWASSTGHAYVDYKDDLNFRANGTGGAVTFKADGKVGIGTTSVTTGHILETRGAVLISSTTGVGNTHFPYTDGRFYYTADPETGGTGDHVFRQYSGGSYVEQMRILENGNVGIGDSTPTYKLDVNGTARFTDQVYVQSILNVTNDLKVDTDTLFVDVSTDRVGINDSTPSYALDVTGDIRATGRVRTDLIGASGGDDLGIGAGETANYMSGNISGEHLWLGAEGNTNIVTSPDNWASGWAGRHESHLTPLSDGSLRVTTNYGNIEIGPKNTSYCHIYTDRSRFYFDVGIDSSPYYYWRNNSGIGGPLVDTSSTSGYRYVLQNQTYGTFFDYTSVRDRKDQITNVTAEDSGRWIDALQPVTYIERWLGEGEEPEDAKQWREADMQVGFIADDILANSDTDHFSQVLDNGEGGLDPAGWKWECVIAAAVAEIKALRGREAALEARIAALEAQ